jgi:hypothetical protein
MRLLQLQGASSFSLVEFQDNSVPPYAILSHTWGPSNEEVTYQDLLSSTGEGKSGYRKLTFCGEQATKDGLQHFWIDTCCIDKSSSAELSEAINSMFRWYREAAKCYVYLSDVSTANQKARNKFSDFTWELAFLESRWFTRGWTLQELLAPRSVEFFSEEGIRLGDKETLERQIYKITGIATLALQGTHLGEFGIEERLSWAKSRRTTRGEDKAYSLLGIFGIYMPLIYGEGEENAFRRLQEEINKLSKGLQRKTNALSIVGTSAAIIQSINAASVSISSFIRSVRESRSDLSIVDSELRSIKVTLELLREDLDIASGSEAPLSLPNSLEEQILGIMDCCATTIKHIKEFFGKYRDLLAKSTAGQVRWAINGKLDIRRYRSILESNRRALEIAIDVLSWTMTREVKKDIIAIQDDTVHAKKDTTQILEEIAKLQDQLPRDLLQASDGRDFLLDKYLESLTSYTETLEIDIHTNWDIDTNGDLSEPDADVLPKVPVIHQLSQTQLPLHPFNKGAYTPALGILQKMGFTGPYSTLPKSFLLAVHNRITRDQFLQPRIRTLPFKQYAPLFTVGAFLFPGTICAITDRKSLRDIAQNMTPAMLRGYQRRSVEGRSFPALVPSSDPIVEVTGMLVFGLDSTDRKTMHAFQNDMYDLSRVTVEVELQDRTKEFHEAVAYIWNGPLAELVPLENRSWSPSDMLRDEWMLGILEVVEHEEAAL